MKLVRIVTTALVVAAGWLFTTTEAGATPEMSKKEKTGCASCHVSKGQDSEQDRRMLQGVERSKGM
ncbi:MAG: hypothetical protein FJW30_13285 [Acidobacteria bacterium]|nr:hypothetical protein [Acidobacteriota bacterium]